MGSLFLGEGGSLCSGNNLFARQLFALVGDVRQVELVVGGSLFLCAGIPFRLRRWF